MELKDYIETSLEQILEGVRAAAAKDLAIAPAAIEGKPIWTERLIEFEVQVIVDKSAAGGLKVLSVAEFGGDITNSSCHRVSFAVPVHMNVAKRSE